MPEVYQSSNAAANITKILEAAAEAQKSQVELKKQVMLHQIQQKMDLEQKAKENIQEKNINYNYIPGGDNSNIASGQPAGPATPAASPMGDVLSPAGTADSGTSAAISGGSPMASVMSPAQAPIPPMTMANPAQQPARDAASQPAPMSAPPPAQAPQMQPQGQPSAQYQNLGYKPIEAPQLLQQRQQSGQRPNVADAAYVQALSKVKAGTASQGEMDMVHNMNNRTSDGVQIPKPGQPAVGGTPPGSQDVALRTMEQRLGYPEGALWRNPSTMAPEISPIWKSKIEATQRAQANFDVNKDFREEGRQNQLEKSYADRLAKIASSRNGALGTQDNKVNSGVHALTLLDQAYDPVTKTFNIPPIMQADLAANVNNAISNQNVTSDSMRQDLMQRSISGDWNKTMQYLLNTPKNSLPQDNAKLMAAMIIRQGPVSENERDKAMQDLKDMVPTGLDQDRADHLNKIQFGTSFKEQLVKSQFYKDLFANDPRYKDVLTAGQSSRVAPGPSGTGDINGPSVGEVDSGYKFKGGDPSDKNNWEKV